MNYTHTNADGQMEFSFERCTFLMIPSSLDGFSNSYTTEEATLSGRNVYRFNGCLEDDLSRTCSRCGNKMHVNNHIPVSLRHLCFGGTLTVVSFTKLQLRCPVCGATVMQDIPFKAEHHRITKDLFTYTMDLLALGKYTNRQVAYITGLDENTVKTIDKKRLQDKYTLDGKALTKPEEPAKFLGIDEFKLHNGHRYAIHIVNLENGHILWISHGKKKQVVYDFIDHVGMEWMDHVEAVACDINSDFQEAFEEKCPHIQPVFDYFHIVKNFNDKVVSAVRKDEQRRLLDEGDKAAAKSLKHTKYILTSSRDALERKDQEAREGKVVSKGSSLFSKETVTRKEGYLAKYEELIKENKLLFTVDLIKTKLSYAYASVSEPEMAKSISEIMDLCSATGNVHFQWFRRLLDKHFEGIIAHATYRISSGKIEGLNNKIKTLRHQGYGYPDDEYFFLKLIDASRNTFVRNPKSHKILE